MNYFKELKVWQKAIELLTNTYLKTQSFPKEEIYGLTSQIRRCAVSIPSNIAEGCGRNTDKDFNFLEAEIQHIQNMIIKLKSSIEKKV
jgi:hypothetical protein